MPHLQIGSRLTGAGRPGNTPSGGGGGSSPVIGMNEPTGMTLSFQRNFNSTAGLFSGDVAIVSDSSAPHSPPNILRATRRLGEDDQGSIYLYNDDGTDDFGTIYVAYWARYSANWQGHSTGVNKECYVWTNGDLPSVYFDANGGGDGDLTPQLETQGAVSTPLGAGEVHLTPNLVPSVRIIRTQWQLREFILKGNSSGTANGAVDFFLDGVHVGSYGSIQWRSGTSVWNMFRQTSFWGGNTHETADADMSIDWDHLYVSGKP